MKLVVAAILEVALHAPQEVTLVVLQVLQEALQEALQEETLAERMTLAATPEMSLLVVPWSAATWPATTPDPGMQPRCHESGSQ